MMSDDPKRDDLDPIETQEWKDALEAVIERELGRAIQLEVSRIDSAGSNVPTFWFAVDSNTMTLPGNIPDFISAFTEDTDTLPDDLPPVFAAGRYYTVTVAQPDQNYFDFTRSGNLPLSGRGFRTGRATQARTRRWSVWGSWRRSAPGRRRS